MTSKAITPGVYRIYSAKETQKFLEIQSDNSVKLNGKRDVLAQRWNIETEGDPAKPLLKITNEMTQSVLGVQRSGQHNYVAGGYPRYRWEADPRGKAYTIGVAADDRVVDIHVEDNVIISERTGDISQRWIFEPFIEEEEREAARKALEAQLREEAKVRDAARKREDDALALLTQLLKEARLREDALVTENTHLRMDNLP